MSLAHVLRAEKLGTATEVAPAELDKINAADLATVTAESGCNMLMVYLLARFGDGLSGGAPRIVATEDVQNQVVDAYVAAGCLTDNKVSSKRFSDHAGPSYVHQIRLRGKLSALGIVRRLLEMPEFEHSSVGEVLRRLDGRLISHSDGTFQAEPAPIRVPTSAHVVCGVKLELSLGSPAALELEPVCEALGLSMVAAGDPEAESGLVIGLRLSSAYADDGPVEILDADLSASQKRYLDTLGTVEHLLVASGPLATAYLVTGQIGTRAAGGDGEFIVGTTTQQEEQLSGVWGATVAQVHLGARAVTLCDAPCLMVRYD